MVLAAFLLVFLYTGPYVYVYAMTSMDVFPRVESLDRTAMDNLKVTVAPDGIVRTISPGFGGEQTLTVVVNGQPVTWTEITYGVKVGVLNRIFSTYIHFPALLDVRQLAFQAVGVVGGRVIMTCDQHVDRLITPTGFEVLTIFGSILRAGNNTFFSSFCKGPGRPDVDLFQFSQAYGNPVPITLNWVITATLRGDKVEETRSWTGSQNSNLILP